jgi:4-diphosphocytidyl-2-C-methyl-D-erythritol kinase
MSRPRRGRRRLRTVVIEARAKLNLGLAVGPRRPDGYHEIATVFQSISLSDTLEIRPRRGGFRLSARFEDVSRAGRPHVERIPTGPANLVLKAARLLKRSLGLQGGAEFRLVKRIPIGTGLGGGSADAAAALVGLARMAGVSLSRRRRMELGALIGADVPFACLGGTAVGTGRGERLRSLRGTSPFRAIVAVPSWRVSTAEAYRRIDRAKYGLTGWKAYLRFVQRLGRDEVTAIRRLRLGNSFEEVLRERQADFLSLAARLRKAGLRHVRMTGSGSAVFGMVRPGERVASVVGRFSGHERLYAVGSTRSSLRIVGPKRLGGK